METVIMIAQLIAGLSILVLIHELGHYLAARAFGIRVEKFYLFFDAWKFKLLKFKIGETEYGIGWLPLGGYVKIAGMIDESMDKEAMKKPPQPWEFRSKPAWQRLIVMLAGVIMNVILGMILFTYVTYHYEKEYLPVANIDNGIYAYPSAREIGFQTGDKILYVNGKQKERFKDITGINVLLGSTITVDRNGKTIDISVPDDFYKKYKENNLRDIFLDAHNYPCIIDTVFQDKTAGTSPLQEGDRVLMVDTFPVKSDKDLPALYKIYSGGQVAAKVLRGKDTLNMMLIIDKEGKQLAGLQKGDLIIGIDTTPVNSWGNAREKVWGSKGQTLNFSFIRSGDTLSMLIPVDTTGMVGIYCKPPYANKPYSIGSAIVYGVSDAMGSLVANVRGLGKIFTGKESASDSLQGPIGIAKIYGSVWSWYRFWLITGLLSMILAFMNILPIPALDGGHVLFTTWEMISGKKLSDKFMERAQIVGMVIILLIMVFAIGNDIWKSIF